MPPAARRQDEVWAGRDGALDFAAQHLPAYLMKQRWYPAKDAGPPAVTLAALVPMDLPNLPAAIAIWGAQPPGRDALRLFLPIAVFERGQLAESDPAVIGQLGGGVLADAFACDAFVRAFVRLIVGSASVPGLQAGQTAQLAPAGLPAGEEWSVRRGTAEQSNTSIRIGDAAILKVIRKLEQGIHPELEMGRFLTEKAHFTATPALLGWLDSEGSTLAILQTFVTNDGDAWSWILDRLREGSGPSRAKALEWVRGLGAATAAMHAALAGASEDPAFAAEPASEADWQRWIQDVAQMSRRVLETVKANRAILDPAQQASADELERRSAGLAAVLRGLTPRSPVAKTRHHGDYHLGQVLVRGPEAIIVDFEGEPLRPLTERRAKHVALRDVAGMLRSLAYAVAVTERELPESLPATQRRTVAEGLHRWAAEASDAYLESYLAAAANVPSCPADPEEARRLVRFFTIEKALYEVAYELANRPAWVSIPLNSVLSLLEGNATQARSAATKTRSHALPQGAELLPEGGVRFRLWAPASAQMRVELSIGTGAARLLPMAPVGEGWHELVVPEAGAGTRYFFVLPDDTHVPDPASRYQPEDIHGPSEVIDPRSYAWRDGTWQSRPWHEAVVYELHVGTFTAAGTFRAAIERLDYLAGLGITAIELMPIGDFPGGRNWGYDGVLMYAPDSSYGRPEDLKALIEAAHARGIMVLLDVVYNHFGPDGNYLPVYAPAFFTDRHHTPWGAAVNFDGPHSPPVREFIIHNALYWIEEYHFDGLRLDAVHAILDDGAHHVLEELAERVRDLRRCAHLILENEENHASRLLRAADGTPIQYTAQWNDDVHHGLHTAATGEGQGYYQEYLGDTEKLGRALAQGFAFQGQVMAFRGTPRGEPSALLPPTAFVAFVQNHDQIGNRAFGERITKLASSEAVRAVVSICLLLPQVPMLFMGEEWGADQPFPFFCDFDGELADAVRKGRRAEFAKFPEFQDEATRERIPDPQAPSTFESAKLVWSDLQEPRHASWSDFYKRLLGVRREALLPLLPLIGGDAGRYEVLGRGAVRVTWRLQDGGELALAANLSADRAAGFPPTEGRILWQEGKAAADGRCDPWSVCWSVKRPAGRS